MMKRYLPFLHEKNLCILYIFLLSKKHKLNYYSSLIVLFLLFTLIEDNRDVDEVVLTMSGGPYQEYFYVQIPLGTEGKSRR